MLCNRIARLTAVSFALVLAVALALVIGIRARGDARALAVERLRLGLERFEEEIDISEYSIKTDELMGVFSDAVKDSPYLFFVSNNLSYTYGPDGIVICIRPRYRMNRQQADAAVEYCRREIKEIADLIDRKSVV